MWFNSYLNADLGDSSTITNFLIGLSFIVIAIAVKRYKVVRLEYRDPIMMLLLSASAQRLLSIFSVPPLIQTSLDTLVAMVAVAVAIVLARDESIR